MNSIIKDLEEVKGRWPLMLFFGIVLIILGMLAIGAAVFTTLTTMVIWGIILISAGITHGFHAFSDKNRERIFLHILSCIFYGIVGFLLVVNPSIGALSLTLLLAVFFLVGGLFRSINSLITKTPNWGWSFASGVISFILGMMILSNWPSTALWVIGTFVGVDLIFSGWSVVMLALAIKESYHHPLDQQSGHGTGLRV